MKLHERHHLVSRARLELETYVIEWKERHGLTLIEEATVVAQLIAEPLKYALRVERHGPTSGKRADEA